MARMSFLPVDKASEFSLANVPFGIFSNSTDPAPRPATRVGDTVVDIRSLARAGHFDDLELPKQVFENVSL